MKPFNLEEFKAGKPAISEANGRWWFVGELPEFCNPDSVFCVIATSFNGQVAYFDRNGKARDLPARSLTHMAPQKKKLWVGIHKDTIDRLLKSKPGFILATESVHLSTVPPTCEEWQICEIEVDV